jgi:hypothetical protein
MMFVGSELIEAMPLDKELISKPGYLGNYKRRMQNKYRELFLRDPKPEFYVVSQHSEVKPVELLLKG